MKINKNSPQKKRHSHSARRAAGMYNKLYFSYLKASIKRHVMFARMVAARAFGRRFGALVDIAADKTEPTDRFVAFPHRAFLNLFLIASKTTFVTKLNLGNRTEMFGNLGEAFRLGDLC